ncbi:hypothetical protein [Micromonospora sp. LOL_023]|uniref:hypothetical protein n=1 Tax=Micromonospora sp. LOL_023 TaxID=3345418 RepID=UPI003A88ED12
MASTQTPLTGSPVARSNTRVVMPLPVSVTGAAAAPLVVPTASATPTTAAYVHRR